VAAVVPKSVAGSRFPDGSSMLLTFDVQLICAEFSSIQVKTQADWMLLQSSYFNPQVSTSRYVVPTGRVVVPTGRYVVPAGKVIIIVSPGRLNLVPTGKKNRTLIEAARTMLADSKLPTMFWTEAV
ncbi:hypothetical protein Tco_0325418, partial [Tanacetum coccineum]